MMLIDSNVLKMQFITGSRSINLFSGVRRVEVEPPTTDTKLVYTGVVVA